MTYGFVSVDTHPRESRVARVRLNGVDVTRGCFAANDVEGWVDRFVRDASGNYRLNPERTGIQHERLHGEVVIDFPRGLD